MDKSPGDILRIVLKEQRMSLLQLSDLSGISPSEIVLLAEGSTPFTLEVSTGISEVLGTLPDFWSNLQEEWYEANFKAKTGEPSHGQDTAGTDRRAS